MILFGVVYWLRDPFVQKPDQTVRERRPRILFSLLLNLDTFTPVVNLSGVQDWGWMVSDGYRWLEVTQRALGVLVLGAAAYSVGSYLV